MQTRSLDTAQACAETEDARRRLGSPVAHTEGRRTRLFFYKEFGWQGTVIALYRIDTQLKGYSMSRSIRFIAGFLFLGACLPLTAYAAPAALTPPDLPGVTVVTAAQARDLMAQGVLIVDTRVANEYVEQRIKGAVNIPY